MIKKFAALLMCFFVMNAVKADDPWPNFTMKGFQQLVNERLYEGVKVIIDGYEYRLTFSKHLPGNLSILSVIAVMENPGKYTICKTLWEGQHVNPNTLNARHPLWKKDCVVPEGFEADIRLYTFKDKDRAMGPRYFAVARKKVEALMEEE